MFTVPSAAGDIVEIGNRRIFQMTDDERKLLLRLTEIVAAGGIQDASMRFGKSADELAQELAEQANTVSEAELARAALDQAQRG
jgi:hypothetical protein